MDALNATCFWSHDGATTLEERAYLCLHDAITAGTLPPGTRLVGSQVADRLGVSRTTTGNAIKRLATEGLVVYRPHSDVTVSSLDEATLREVFLIRHALEEVIMREAARHVDHTTLKELALLNDEIAKSIGDENPEAYRRIERDYHMRVYAEANLPMLATILTELWNRIEPYRGRRYSGKSLLHSTIQEHRDIESALAARDEEASVHAMRVHVQTGHEQIAAMLQWEAEARLVQSPATVPSRRAPSRSSVSHRAPSGSLRSAFDNLPDIRRRQGMMFDLTGVLTLATCAMLCGARSRYVITRWGQRCHPEIRTALGLPQAQGPSVATIHRVLSNLDRAGYERAVYQWLEMRGIDPKEIPHGKSSTIHLRGVHGEELPGISVIANLAAAFRAAYAGEPTVSNSCQQHLLDLPALLLAGEQDRATMRLAIIELRRSILEMTASSR
jgi:DNA-binding GntR family transcriptional regulator